MAAHRFSGSLQLGKQGVTDNFIETLKGYFKNHTQVRISVLRSATRNKEELKKINEKILEALGKNYKSRVIGYTLVINKFKKSLRD
ncbi:MAG: YhbY family RNA-binding protein [Nanoarchaeota archaeon]